VPTPGPQNGRYAAEPTRSAGSDGADQPEGHEETGREAAQRQRAGKGGLGDTVKRIDGTEVPLTRPPGWASGPERLKAPRKGKADDLKEIEGIGPAMEKLVNSLGFFHFEQIASWSDADVALVDAEMKTFKGRISRDRWVAQAKIIVTEGLEAFRERAKTNNY
jgi:hypothetical protein